MPWWVFLVCKYLADREQFRAFLFLVCIYFADQEHLGAYAALKMAIVVWWAIRRLSF